jgi:hypothetical protein
MRFGQRVSSRDGKGKAMTKAMDCPGAACAAVQRLDACRRRAIETPDFDFGLGIEEEIDEDADEFDPLPDLCWGNQFGGNQFGGNQFRGIGLEAARACALDALGSQAASPARQARSVTGVEEAVRSVTPCGADRPATPTATPPWRSQARAATATTAHCYRPRCRSP